MTTTINLCKNGWAERTRKEENNRRVRMALSENILSSDEYRMLCFPAEGWLFELGLMDRFASAKFSITGLEYSKKFFDKFYATGNRIKKAIIDQGDSTEIIIPDQPCSLEKYARTFSDKPFNLIYADWMGTWGLAKKNEVELIMQNRMIVSGGHLLITISMWRGGRGPCHEEIADQVVRHMEFPSQKEPFLVDNSTIEFIKLSKHGKEKTFGVTQVIKDLASAHGQMATLQQVYCYKEPNVKKTKTAPCKTYMPMISMLFQIDEV